MKDPALPRRYQDYVIRDGKFVGEFEKMYADCDDPWQQKTEDFGGTARNIGLTICRRLKTKLGCNRVIELGCGYGRYANALSQQSLEVIGIDVAPAAIAKARADHPSLRFEVGSIADHDLIASLKPDVIVMSHISWYVLPQLKDFVAFLRQRLPEVMLYHVVALYPGSEQKYGREYFTTNEEVLQFFGLHYAEWGEVHNAQFGIDAFFLGSTSQARIDQW